MRILRKQETYRNYHYIDVDVDPRPGAAVHEEQRSQRSLYPHSQDPLQKGRTMNEYIIIAVYNYEGGSQKYNGPTVYAESEVDAIEIGWECWESSGSHVEHNEPDEMVARAL